MVANGLNDYALRIYVSSRDTRIQAQALDSLTAITHASGVTLDPQTANQVLALTTTEDAGTRLRAFRALALAIDDCAVSTAVSRGLADSSPAIVRETMRIVRQTNTRNATTRARLFDLVRDQRVAADAARTIAYMYRDDDSTATALLDLVSSGNDVLVSAGAMALVQIGLRTTHAHEVLASALSATSGFTRFRVAEALWRLGGSAQPLLGCVVIVFEDVDVSLPLLKDSLAILAELPDGEDKQRLWNLVRRLRHHWPLDLKLLALETEFRQ